MIPSLVLNVGQLAENNNAVLIMKIKYFSMTYAVSEKIISMRHFRHKNYQMRQSL